MSSDMVRAVIGLIGLAALGACANPMPDTGPPVAVTPSNAAVVGLDVYGVERAENPQLPAYRGEDTVQVRTFIDPPGNGNRKETRGDCVIRGGSLFEVEVSTPRKIVVPNYGARSPTLAAQCAIQGHTATGSTKVFNRTKRDIANSGASGGALGVLVAALMAETLSDENDVFEYWPLWVEFSTPES